MPLESEDFKTFYTALGVTILPLEQLVPNTVPTSFVPLFTQSVISLSFMLLISPPLYYSFVISDADTITLPLIGELTTEELRSLIRSGSYYLVILSIITTYLVSGS